jgi:phenylacetate-coenzyme A ligase PaaK-like adenylate-forming protein
MHVRSNAVILELLKNGRPVSDGERGEVVVTDLWNEATPIIRYSGLKDIARFSTDECPCGQKAPRLEVIEGRLADSVVLKDGRVIHPFSLTLALEHLSGIARFQIVQDSLDEMRVMVVPEDHNLDQPREIVKALTSVLGDSIAIRAEMCEEIPRNLNGHSGRVVISRVAPAVLK